MKQANVRAPNWHDRLIYIRLRLAELKAERADLLASKKETQIALQSAAMGRAQSRSGSSRGVSLKDFLRRKFIDGDR